jgi:hypothetical protein
MSEIHTLFFHFTCGHEYFMDRVRGGITDWSNCLCNACQPYHAVMSVDHPCGLCGGSFVYFKDDPQAKLSDEEALERTSNGVPFLGPHLAKTGQSKTLNTPCTASIS